MPINVPSFLQGRGKTVVSKGSKAVQSIKSFRKNLRGLAKIPQGLASLKKIYSAVAFSVFMCYNVNIFGDRPID